MEGGLNVQEYEVIFYDKADGTEPAKDFWARADRDLLEYYLYEISALRAKHTYLLRQMKSLETEATS